MVVVSGRQSGKSLELISSIIYQNKVIIEQFNSNSFNCLAGICCNIGSNKMIWSSANISYQMNMFLIVNNDISTNDGSFCSVF